MEAFEDQLVIFEGRGFYETVVDDAEYEIVHAVAGKSNGKEDAGGEEGEDCNEHL